MMATTARGNTANNNAITGFWLNDGGAPIFGVLVTVRILVAIIGILVNILVILAFVSNKNTIGQSFRYLNNVVLSLAIAGFLYSLLGQPCDILYWYYNLSDVGPMYRNSGRTWIMSIVTFPQDICEGASCYHVALIVFMRCLCLLHPMNFRKWHIRISSISILGIYILMFSVVLTPTFIASKMTTNESRTEFMNAYKNAWNVIAAVTIALPVLLNVMLCSVKVFLLRKRRTIKESENGAQEGNDRTIDSVDKQCIVSSVQEFHSSSSKEKELERMIKIVTIGTIVCYTPEIVFRSWFIAIVRQGKPTGTTAGVLFFFFARLSVQLASIINPLIYATTIPKFKTIVTRILRNSLLTKTNDTNTLK